MIEVGGNPTELAAMCASRLLKKSIYEAFSTPQEIDDIMSLAIRVH
jgi:hypothetical protein